jgi:beta-1,4-mannosyltransferase
MTVPGLAKGSHDRRDRAATMWVRRAEAPKGLRPGFGFFLVAYVTFGTFAWTSYTASRGIGPVRWYTSVVWSVPILISTVGLAGGVMTARRMRQRRKVKCAPAPVAGLLVVVIPTIGRDDTIPALQRVVRSLCEHLPAYFPVLRIDVVIEEDTEARGQISALAAASSDVRIITVPSAYRTRNGTRFKARANHYAHELRLKDAETTDDIWVLHMDDDTGVGPDTAEAMAEFINNQRSAGSRSLHLAQGVLSFPREHSRNRLTWLADAVRPGCDISLFAASTGRGWPRAGLHGELLLVRASAEASIGWDFGPRATTEDAHFAMRFCQRYPGRSSWLAGRSYGASPVTMADFVRQRERWVCGLLEVATKGSLPLRRRLALVQSLAVWTCGPIQHPAVVLTAAAALGDLNTSPAIAVLVPLWTLNVSFFVWLYWEGLKINASSSAVPRRLWWEPPCLIALLPLFSLWEVIGIFRGIVQFVRTGEPKFTVIAKPV